jgi:hypothetical protein
VAVRVLPWKLRVERSKKRVVLILNRDHGPLQWRDLQTGGAVIPLGVKPDDPVEFTVSMDRRSSIDLMSLIGPSRHFAALACWHL